MLRWPRWGTLKHGRRVQGERRRRGLALFTSLTAVVIRASGAAVALGAKGDLHLVSRQSDADGGAGANSRSFGASLSDGGRLVAFTSEATNLGSIEGNATVYVYDFANRTVEIVSRQSANAGGLPGDGFSVAAEISGNGRFVVFRTDATNLGGPIAADENIYVYDRREDRVQLVSRRSKAAGGAGANENADSPSISANGRYVSYQTQATNLGGPIDGEGEANVYVYDRRENRTILVSRRSHGGKGGNGNSFETSLAPSARVVVFESQATNLGGPTHPDASANVYAYDWKRRKLELAARRSGNGKGPNSAADVPTSRRPDVWCSSKPTRRTSADRSGDPRELPRLHPRSQTGRTSLVRAVQGRGRKGRRRQRRNSSFEHRPLRRVRYGATTSGPDRQQPERLRLRPRANSG